MQKVACILFSILIITGCASSRKARVGYTGKSEELSSTQILRNTEILNLTSNGFFIEKAEIKVRSEDGDDNFLGSLKYEKPGKYLLSLRNRAGIEGARIFLSEDTIMINDRLNRVYYYGSPNALHRNYGVSASVLPVLLGDYLGRSTDSGNTFCESGILNTGSLVNGIKINYNIDCKMKKAVSVSPESSLNQASVELMFSEFFNQNGAVVPGKIEIKDLRKKSQIEIKIIKIEYPWTGSIEFIPGNNYEKQRLP